MANIIDYIDWRGDILIDCDLSPLNDVDALIFAELSYINFTDLVPSDPCGGWVSLSEVMRTYMSIHYGEKEKLGLIMPDDYLEMARRMASSERFGDLMLTGYVNYIDQKREEQFSALTVALGKGKYLIAFAGTDDTVIGWKEDLNLAFLASIPAQIDASDYLERASKALDGDFILVGHSKGGNLAMYAAASNAKTLSDRIERVFNFDGPGFLAPMIESDGYRMIADKIKTLTPQTSIVGSLLYNDARELVVRSNSKLGVGQHDAFTWQVKRSKFIEAPGGKKTDESLAFRDTMERWLSKMSANDRKELTEIVYKLLGAGGKRTLTELYDDKTAIIRAYRKLSPDDRVVARKHIKALIASGGESIMNKR